MNFVSSQFVVLMVVTWLLFMAIPARFRWLLLLAASYVFYASWSIPFVAIILITTTVDYLASKIIYANASPSFRKLTLWTAILINLAVLAYFKYSNFFLDINASLMQLFGVSNALPTHVELLLPLGISYYTFEAISYLVDVYRGQKPAVNWLSYNFYIMYFPHLISGPIVRFNELWPQYMNGIQRPTLERLGKGLELIILGYFFKVFFADSCASFSDPVYSNPAAASVLSTYVGVLGFTVQLYFDFLGYTHIARGCSLLFNLKLPINFNHPLNSANMADFWQRWQISLSRWLHDYLFVPLGGSRKSFPRTFFNIFITLLVAGIWHGAGWSYVSMGVFFGLSVGGYHAWRRLRKKLFKSRDRAIINHPVYAFAAEKLTFIMVIFFGMFFRAPDMQTLQIIFQRLLEFPQLVAQIKWSMGTNHYTDIGMICAMLAILQFGPWAARQYERVFVPLPYWMKLQTATAVALLCWIYCAEYTPPFIYFQF